MQKFLNNTKWLWVGAAVILLVGLLVPSPGIVEFGLKNPQKQAVWPQFEVVSDDRSGEVRVIARDIEPWTHVLLESDFEQAVPLAHGNQDEGGAWMWEWQLASDNELALLQFFHSCDVGCREWGAVRLRPAAPLDKPADTTETAASPTKLGVVLANPDRDWHGKQGWSVEIAYADSIDEDFWSVDDLAMRVRQHEQKGTRVLVRVEFAQKQSLPLPDDYVGLEQYLTYLERLVNDVRLQSVHGYIIGSNMNAAWANQEAEEGQAPVSAAWYARVFNGYGGDPGRTDNVMERIRPTNHAVRLIAGPINPWNEDATADVTNSIDAPWLNYMNSMVAYLDEGAAQNMAAGVAATAPDGFAVQAFGRVNHAAVLDGAAEPATDLPETAWDGAQSGFRMFEDWLAIINRYESTNGKPVYINATNTFDGLAGSVPVDNYPAGWLTAALGVIDDEPQIAALCWFMDYFPHDTRWENYSLASAKGLLTDAAAEFEQLLQK